MYCKTFFILNKVCNPICKLLKAIYKHNINKQERNGIFNIISGVKYHFLFVWQYVMYVTHFKAFNISKGMTMSNCQSIFTFVKWFILELFKKKLI